jgi:Ala-tRNA(Pro) deacylase
VSEAAGAALGGKVELASEEEFAGRFTDCEVGAEPPLGNIYGMPVYVDLSLREDPEIVFNAGRHDEAIRMRYADFERLVRPAALRSRAM